MYWLCAGKMAVAGVGSCGVGYGLVSAPPTRAQPTPVPPRSHGWLKHNCPVVFGLLAVAYGGFCSLRCALKKFTSSYATSNPTRNTVLPVPVGSNERPMLGENSHGVSFVNLFEIPGSPKKNVRSEERRVRKAR